MLGLQSAQLIQIAGQVGRLALPAHLRRLELGRHDLGRLPDHHDDRSRGSARVQVVDRLDDRRIQLSIDALHVDDAVVTEARDETGEGRRGLSLCGGQAFKDGNDLHRRLHRFHRQHLALRSVQVERELLAGQTGDRGAIGIEHGDKEPHRGLRGDEREGDREERPCQHGGGQTRSSGHCLMYFLTSRGLTSAP